MNMIPILAAVVALAGGAFAVMTIMSRFKGGGSGSGGVRRNKSRDALFKSATKKLNQNPKDPGALVTLGAIHFEEESWDKAFKIYETLLEIMGGSHQDINEFEVFHHYGISALKLGMINEAYRGLSSARNIKQDNFEINHNLGVLEFQRKNYEKAIQILQQARVQDPEHAPTLRYMGHALFKLKKYKEAMTFIRKAIDVAPDDKESLFVLAECYQEANQIDPALKIFSHLRADPNMGPSASLSAGLISLSQHHEEKAIEDFEIGLKHVNIKPEVALELKYRLATAYLKKNEIGKALSYLKDINLTSPTPYKDVQVLIGKYQEMNANKNLQIFLMASSADFVALCRKVVMTYFQRAKVKITNITVNKNEWADILAEIDTPKWSDVVMFRFIRTQGSIGELIVRDFHSHLKEVKAGKGICITVGNYTEEARRYTEARLIDLIEKDKLAVILNSVDARTQAATPAKKK